MHTTNARTDHASFASDLNEIGNQYKVPLSPSSPFCKVLGYPAQTYPLHQRFESYSTRLHPMEMNVLEEITEHKAHNLQQAVK